MFIVSVTASVRLADGSERAMPLSQLTSTLVLSAVPWRVIRSHRGQRHLPGVYWSSTTGAWRVHGLECASFTPGYRLSCWDCDDTNGYDYDSTVTAARFGTGIYGATIANFSDYLGEATIYLADPDDPAISLTDQPPTDWTNTPTGTIAANASDPGLGVESIEITGGGITYNSGCLEGGPCPNTMSRSASVASLNLPDGNNTVAVTARDASYYSHRDANGNVIPAKHQSSATASVRLDRGKPIITPSGTLNGARNGFIGTNQDYTLDVTATDGSLSSPAAQRSGATSLSATLDGQPMTNGSAAAACTRPEGSCSLAINATLTAAQIAELDETVPHTIEITGSDALGHTSAPDAFTFRVDAIAPTISSEGDLLKVSGSPLTEDLYHVNVEARDNAPTIPEVDDDGTEIAPDDLPGAGMKDLVVRVDGESVATTPIACFTDPACEQAHRWTWDTTQVSNGVHTITITAADKVDNQDVESFQVDVQRQPNEPPRTNTTVRRTILGATTSDRTGNSVAAIGDVNGDGHSDYLIGAPDVGASGLPSMGAAYIVLGQADQSTIDLATPSASVRRIVGPGQGWYCGTSVAAAGDVNRDGLGDLLVGCPGVDSRIGSLLSTGRVYVIFGRTDPQDINLASLGTAGFAINGPTDTLSVAVPAITSRPAVFGERLQSTSPDQLSKDVNGDGYDDIVIGDSAVGRGLDTGVGTAYVIYGKADSSTVAVTALGEQGFTVRGSVPSSLTGYSAAITDDVTGDTIPDILIGAPGATAGTGGRAYVVSGSAADGDVDLASSGNRAITLTTGQAGDRFGVNIAALGDTDLDTYADVAIGTAEGAYVLRKVPSANRTISADDGFRIVGPANVPGLLLATTVPEAPIAPTGDLDGDERADLIVGYPDASGNRAYSIRSPDASRTLNVNALPGQRGAAITTGTQADRAGAAVAGNTYLGDEPTISENAQSIVGAPSAARAYIIGEPLPVGPGVTPDPDPEDAGPLPLSTSAAARSTTTERAVIDTPNGPVPGVYRVKASEATEWVTVRNDAQSFVIGSAHSFDNLYADSRKFGPGDGDSVDGRKRYYLHGLFGNGVHRCGWIIQKQTLFNFIANPFPGRTCRGRPRRLPPYRFAKLMNSDGKGDGTFVRLRWIHSKATATETQLRDDLPSEIPLYRNVRPGTNEVALSPDETLPTTTIEDGVRVRTPIRWRYITKSGKFVLIRVSKTEFPQVGQNGWVFISRAWLPKAFGANRLCDDGTGTGAKTPKQSDWAPVCSHKKTGYVVADHE